MVKVRQVERVLVMARYLIQDHRFLDS